MRDTIHALATARGRAGVAIIRVSGPNAAAICECLAGRVPPPRVAQLCRICAPDGALIDKGLVLFFPDGESFTGEPVVEFHLHGGPAIIDAVDRSILETGLARPAQAGEFTRRAFLAGRMDLTQVHGLADALDAETEVQRVAAMRRLSGETAQKFGVWRDHLLACASRLEASIDFPDEDLPEDVLRGLKDRIRKVLDGLSQDLQGYRGAHALRAGYEVALVGPPNAGKSSLINALTAREVAIVSEVPGTTRDVLEARIVLHGVPVTFLDTAGLREAGDAVERQGIDRARDRAKAADLRLWLSDDGERGDPADLVVRTKSDLRGAVDGPWDVSVSSRTGEGIQNLLEEVSRRLSQLSGSAGDISRSYEKDAFHDAAEHLQHVLNGWDDMPVEIIAGEIHAANRALEIVLGGVGVEETLGEIFSSFCIGK